MTQQRRLPYHPQTLGSESLRQIPEPERKETCVVQKQRGFETGFEGECLWQVRLLFSHIQRTKNFRG